MAPTRAPQFPVSPINPCGLDGIDFIEFASPEPQKLAALFEAFGFTHTREHGTQAVSLYQQGDIGFLLNRAPRSFAEDFAKAHGPGICAMGWRTLDAVRAHAAAIARGAQDFGNGDHAKGGSRVPAISGIGESLIYFVDGTRRADHWDRMGFLELDAPRKVAPKGFVAIDHLTNNVERGTLKAWSDFYKELFGFSEVRRFDIRGEQTGLTSYALCSPCGRFCIPINEADEQKSQINEYLEEYQGPGIQHLAFLTDDLLGSLRALEGSPIEMLDIDADYYQRVFERLPQVREDRAELQRRSVLIDGDAQGYLLQIFTKNLVGPIFIELIQRENHFSFGEGNFGALFRSIERDQVRRGVRRGVLPAAPVLPPLAPARVGPRAL
jgi:4-hydroxyphenylpyruvate dioxygenase